jgi:hypothetical protein
MSQKRPGEYTYEFGNPGNLKRAKPVVLKARIEELNTRGYKPVERSLLVDPNNPVFVKVENWADKDFPQANIAATETLLQSMYANPGDTVIFYIQCHGNYEKEITLKKNMLEENGIVTTTIYGVKTDSVPALFVPIPTNVVCVSPSPFGTLSSSKSNYDNNVVGTIINPTNHNKIVQTVATGNVDKLFSPESQSNRVKEDHCIIGCGGMSPNLQLDFKVETEPTNIATALWRSFVISSNAHSRNKNAFLPKSDATYHSISSAAEGPINKESPLAMGDDPAKNYTLNHTFNLLGNEPAKVEAEKNLLKYLDTNDGKISLQTFLDIMSLAIGDKNAIFFFDTCTEFSIDCVFNLNTGGTVNMPIDQIYDKTLHNYNYQPFFKQTKLDPDIKNAYDQYFEACNKFKPVIKPTIYWNLPSQPAYNIRYSPIVDIVTHRVMLAFNAIRRNYLANCVKGEVKGSFDMGTMPTIKTFYQVQSSVLANTGTGYTDSFSQKQDVPYLNHLVPLPRVYVPSNSSSTIGQSIEIPQPQSQSQHLTFLDIILKNVTLFGDHVTSYFKEKKSDDNPIITNGKISEEVSPFVDSAGGGSIIQPMFPDVSAEELRLLRNSGLLRKGGSRKRPNIPKNRKTMKNKKQRKTKNRKNRQPNRNKSRRQ